MMRSKKAVRVKRRTVKDVSRSQRKSRLDIWPIITSAALIALMLGLGFHFVAEQVYGEKASVVELQAAALFLQKKAEVPVDEIPDVEPLITDHEIPDVEPLITDHEPPGVEPLITDHEPPALESLPASEPRRVVQSVASGNDMFYHGADISALHLYEGSGVAFTDAEGEERDLISIMMDYGVNTFRLRLFVDPVDEGRANNNLERTLCLAKRIKAKGAMLLLDFHYSDTWADPGHQHLPEAWKDLSFDELVERVEAYTSFVISAFDEESCRPDLVQIGNEITPGMLWPHGQVNKSVGEDNDTVQQWNQLCQLLQAGVRGVESVTGVEDRPKVLLHTTTAGWYRGTEKWFGHMERNGVNYDMIAWSYYPEHHGSLQKLQENISLTVQRFKKPVVIVETSYPASDRSLLEEGVRDIKSVMAYPMSESGQKEFLEELISICKGAPHQLGKGVFWWFPEALQPPTKAILKKSGIKLGFSGWKNGADALFTWCDPVVPFELRAKPRAALEAFRASGWR